MNRKERLSRLYFNQEVDRPAVYCRSGFPINDSSYNPLKKYINEHCEIKLQWQSSNILEKYNIDTHIEKFSKDFNRQITILHTPKGNLKKIGLISLKDQATITKKYFLETEQDIEKYLSLPIPKVGGSIEGFYKLEKDIQNTGIVQIGLGINPAGVVVELFGSELFAELSITNRQLIHELIEKQTQIALKEVKYLKSKKIGTFYYMLGEEYLVPPLHGPKDFYDFVVKYDKQIIDVIHETNGRIHIHSHGSIKKVIDGFIEMGSDVLHPFESPPLGDITAKEAKEKARDKMCLEGNIQISHMYENTKEQIKEETINLIKDCFDDNKGLIVSPTASPYIKGEGHTCFNQYKEMIDIVTSYKKCT